MLIATLKRSYTFPLFIFFIIIYTGCSKDDAPDNGIKDRDGNKYTTITLGTQTWMVENLRTTKFNDGTDIPMVTDADAWSSLLTPGYEWYNDDKAANKVPYGALYNWYTVATGKLCPEGWHVPSTSEFNVLIDFLGGADVAGGKMKEEGTSHWSPPNTGANGESGFNGLAAGEVSSGGMYANKGYYLNMWTSEELLDYAAHFFQLYYGNAMAFANSGLKRNGYSVRCLQD